MPLIECVPNISEGRRVDAIERIASAIRGVSRVRLLHYTWDRSQNRSVFTFVGEARDLTRAVLAMYEPAVAAIDLGRHRGEHPRIGAVDVVPFVPVDASMADCVALAREVGAEIAARYGVPVYLYEEAASSPARKNLEDIRRGEFEGLATKMAQAAWAPDFGPPTPHATAGASAVGARRPLIAFNVNLATDRLDVARKVARTVRSSGGGLPFVKALGVRTANPASVQVTMNLTNYAQTSLWAAFDAVRREAERAGVQVVESEIVGLVPEGALRGVTPAELLLKRFTEDQVLEHRIRS